MWHSNWARRFQLLVLLMGLIVAFISCPTPSSATEPQADLSDMLARGQQLYQRACLLCHGQTGDGDGPDAFYLGAYSAPRPRAFTEGEYKFRSTPSGELPTDSDLFETITNGIPGYMPSFRSLAESDRWDIVSYIKQFSPFFQETDKRTPIALPPGPLPPSKESINRGHELYTLLDCAKCHSPLAIAPNGLYEQGELRDRRELDILPPDLSKPASFKNGYRPQDIAQSIMTGLDGTPMASFRETLPRPEDIWHLVNYVLSFSDPQ